MTRPTQVGLVFALAITGCFAGSPSPAVPVTPTKPPEPAEWATPAGAWLTSQRIVDVVADDRYAFALVGEPRAGSANALARIDMATGDVLETPRNTTLHPLYRIVRDPDGRLIAFGTTSTEVAYVVDPTTLALAPLAIPQSTKSSPSPGPLRVVQSFDGAKLLLCLVGRPIVVRDLRTLAVIAPSQACEFPDGTPAMPIDPRIAIVAPHQLGVFDTTMKTTRTREGYAVGAITEIVFDGTDVLSSSNAQHRWTGPTHPTLVGRSPSLADPEPGPCANTTQIHPPSGREVAVVGNAGIYRLDAAGKQIGVLEEYSRDRHAVYTTGDEIALVEDVDRGGRLILWTPSGARAWHSPLGAPITAIAVDRTTKRLAIGHADGTLELRLLARIRSAAEPFAVEIPMFEKMACPP